MQWQMMQRYVQWFGDVASAPITVAPPAPAPDGAVTYLHTDALGSPIARSDSAGNVIARTAYEPYGRTASGNTPTIGFTGHVNDGGTGLVYMQQRYYDPVAGRFLSVDPVITDANTGTSFNRFSYANNSPYKYTDLDGRCAERYTDGSCKVSVDKATGAAGVAAGKRLEGVLNRYDKAVNALSDKSNFKIKDSNGSIVGSMSGKEIKAVWNGTQFKVTNRTFNNGGAGGGTGGTWTGDSFSGRSELSPAAVSAYASAATSRSEDAGVGLSTLAFHELGHETHYGEALTKKYPVTSTISWPREYGASSAGARMAEAVGAPFDCSIPGGCQ
jgi:RHS repeat-associated protein